MRDNMKFKNVHDMQLFLLEIGEKISLAHDGFEPDQQMLELYLTGRRSMLPKLKNFRRSQASKEAWREYRYKYMKGIKGFHKSTEGKRFHRSLGRFLATRESGMRFLKNEALDLSLANEWVEALKAISSLRTHLFIELDYYHAISEEVDLHILVEEAIPSLSRLEEALTMGLIPTTEDVDLLLALIEPRALLEEFVGANPDSKVQSLLDTMNIDEFYFEKTGAYMDVFKAIHGQTV